MTKKYSLTAEHRAQLPGWAQRWIANAMSTRGMTDDERTLATTAARGLYTAASLAEPKHVVFVSSPLVATIAAGVAAGARYLREHPEKHQALFGRQVSEVDIMGSIPAACSFAVRSGLYRTEFLKEAPAGTFRFEAVRSVEKNHAATDDATSAATSDATYAATDDATSAATAAATPAATYAATSAATYAATRAATDAATYDATYAATDDATYAATDAATRAATYDATYAATSAATDAATCAATDAATRAATRAATYDATRAATDAATDAATRAATDAATIAATDAATRAATDAATYDATRAATDAATSAATSAATDAATRAVADPVGARDVSRFLAMCTYRAWFMRQGGNQWSPWASYLSFFRHIVKLDESHGVDYSKWQHYEALAELSGPRLMHKDFCIISDRPEVLLVDERNRPHCATGPSHRWRDGWELHYWHGIRVSKRMIEQPESYTKEEILAISNTETRRVLAERLGWGRFLEKIGGKPINTWTDPNLGLAYELVELESTGDLVLRKQSPNLKDGTGCAQVAGSRSVQPQILARPCVGG